MNLPTFSRAALKRGLPFLLIGGHAVIGHGHIRTTFDLDLVIPKDSLEHWHAFVLAMGFTVHREGPAFVQYNPPDSTTLPLDLMMVNSETYREFCEASRPAPVAEAEVKMVCLKHLLALKSHAIRHGDPGRVETDIDDVVGLVRINRIDVSEPEWKGLFTKYGPPRLYEKLLRIQQTRTADGF